MSSNAISYCAQQFPFVYISLRARKVYCERPFQCESFPLAVNLYCIKFNVETSLDLIQNGNLLMSPYFSREEIVTEAHNIADLINFIVSRYVLALLLSGTTSVNYNVIL